MCLPFLGFSIPVPFFKAQFLLLVSILNNELRVLTGIIVERKDWLLFDMQIVLYKFVSLVCNSLIR